MNNSRFYLLPKDILIELLHKVYGNLDGFPMEDIYRLNEICKNRIEQDKKEKDTILYAKYKIDDNLVMYYDKNLTIALEDLRIDTPKSTLGSEWHRKSVLEITVYNHLYKFCFYRNINGRIALLKPHQFKTLEELTPHIIQQMSLYDQNIIDECLRIINLILETRDYLITNELNKYV